MPETNLMNRHSRSLSVDNEEDITRFAGYINAGINSWTRAGELLVKMEAIDPLFSQKLKVGFPGFSDELIRIFRRIGERALYPWLLVDGCPAARRLMGFPYDEQARLYSAKIETLTPEGLVVQKRIQEMDVFEAERVFGANKVRRPDEQRDFMRRCKSVKPRIAKKKRAPIDLMTALRDLIKTVESLGLQSAIGEQIKAAKLALEKYEVGP